MRRVAAPTISDRDDREDDLARIVLYFLLSSRVSLQDLECKLYDISMNISPVSQKKNCSPYLVASFAGWAVHPYVSAEKKNFLHSSRHHCRQFILNSRLWRRYCQYAYVCKARVCKFFPLKNKKVPPVAELGLKSTMVEALNLLMAEARSGGGS